MKLLSSTLLCAAMLSACVRPACAENIIIAMSPNTSQEMKEQQAKDLIKFTTEHVGIGEKAVFINGQSLEEYCTFEVPDRKSYGSPKAKLQANGSCVKTLLSASKTSGTEGKENSIDLPSLLRSIGSNYNLDEYNDVVILGDPVWHTDLDPRYSMLGVVYPSDAHITAPRHASPYSMNGLNDLYKGTRVHLSSPDLSWKANDQHFDALQRFWSLEVSALGGELVSFNGDQRRTFQRVKSKASSSGPTYAMQDNEKLEMIQIPVYRGLDIPIYQREVSDTPIDEASLKRARGVEIGISWECDCDLDLHVIAEPGDEVISYSNSRTARGSLHKDYRSGAELQNGFETVTLNGLVDLTQLRAAVNFYGGTAPNGVKGEFRYAVNGKTYAKPFSINATQGNQGKGNSDWLQNLSLNENWIELILAN